ncbi:MAG: hypothetical protein L0Y50_05120 [Beijerinckiaceae bacterium]|nr:hypothetical protein [Beijerinckiaceae bacterium]MCI0735639.1 hypothetical protein [Beijerinckiaceae bacterium]
MANGRRKTGLQTLASTSRRFNTGRISSWFAEVSAAHELDLSQFSVPGLYPSLSRRNIQMGVALAYPRPLVPPSSTCVTFVTGP